MIKRKVATIVFFNKENLIIQDRRKISKWGEEYGFFGGGIENNETPEETLKREIKEELGINVKDFFLFKKDILFIKEVNGEVERNVFLAPFPNLKKIKVDEGDIKIIELNNLPKLKMVSGDFELLKEIKYYLIKNEK